MGMPGSSAQGRKEQALKLLEEGSDIKQEVVDPALAAAAREKAQVLALIAIHDVLSDFLQEYMIQTHKP